MPRKPKFPHDCSGCVLVHTTEKQDRYVCLTQGAHGDFVIRTEEESYKSQLIESVLESLFGETEANSFKWCKDYFNTLKWALREDSPLGRNNANILLLKAQVAFLQKRSDRLYYLALHESRAREADDHEKVDYYSWELFLESQKEFYSTLAKRLHVGRRTRKLYVFGRYLND